MMNLLKFGRRVVFDKQMSNREVLENHINSMHELSTNKRQLHSSQKQEEKEHIDNRKRQDDIRESEKQFYNS